YASLLSASRVQSMNSRTFFPFTTFLRSIQTLIFFILLSVSIIPLVAEQEATTQVSIIKIIFLIVRYLRLTPNEEKTSGSHCVRKFRHRAFGKGINFGTQSVSVAS